MHRLTGLSPTVTNDNGVHDIEGTLDSAANTDFDRVLFKNPICDPNGHGEDHTYLKRVHLTTHGSGDANFDLEFVTQMATKATTACHIDSLGNTSELATCQFPALFEDGFESGDISRFGQK